MQVQLYLKANTSQVIGTSEMYSSTNMRDNGIESVKVNGLTAETEMTSDEVDEKLERSQIW
jgi:uncharacterized protein YegP (UPF0339 family)